MRRILSIAAAFVALAPAAALAQGGEDPVSVPASQLRPMSLTVTTALTTGGSVIRMTVTAGSPTRFGFPTFVNMIACAGAADCKTARVNPRGSARARAVFNFDLDETTSGPVRVGTQVVACAVNFRCASVSRNLQAR